MRDSSGDNLVLIEAPVAAPRAALTRGRAPLSIERAARAPARCSEGGERRAKAPVPLAPERRPQRLPIPKAELEAILQRAWQEAARFQRLG